MNLEFSNDKFTSLLPQIKFRTERTCLHQGQNTGSFVFHPFHPIVHSFKCQFFNFTKSLNWWHIAGDTTTINPDLIKGNNELVLLSGHVVLPKLHNPHLLPQNCRFTILSINYVKSLNMN